MNLINEKDGVWLEVGENSGKVAGAFNRDAGSAFQRRFKRRGDEVGERRLPDSGRAVEENMLRHPAALLGGINSDAHIRLHLFLPHIFVPATGTERRVKGGGQRGEVLRRA